MSNSRACNPLITLINILGIDNIPDDVKMHEDPFFPENDRILVILTLIGEFWTIKRELYSLKIVEIVAEWKGLRISIEDIAIKFL